MILAWDNKSDAAMLSTDSELASLPASNVQQPHVSRKWHTAAGVKSAYLLMDTLAAVSCGVLALLGTNFTSAATLRLRSRDVPDNYLSLPGASGNYASTPDSAATSITGDIDIRVMLAADSWVSGSFQTILSKYAEVDTQRSYWFGVTASGVLRFVWSADGTITTEMLSTGTPGFVAGSAHWVRVTLDVDNGAAGKSAKFYTSEDGIVWTQLGSTVTTAGTTSIFDGPAGVELGAYGPAHSVNLLAGKVFRAQVYNGIEGTLVADFDVADAMSGATSVVSASGETWTINQSGSPAASIVGWLLDTGTVSAGVVSGYGEAYKSFTAVAARYWRLDLADATVPSNLQIGRVFLGPKWSPSVNQEFGWSVVPVDSSDLDESYGQQEYADEKPQQRVVQFSLNWMNEAEMYGNAFAMARANGRVRDVLAIHDIAGAYLSQQAVWGLVQASEPLIHERSQIYRMKFTIRERL